MRRIRRRNKVKRFNITILLLAGFLLSVFCLVIRFADYASGRKEYRQLQEQLEAFADSLSNQTEEWNWNREEEEEEDEWTRLMISRNPDYVFWLWIPGTNISYPVVKNTIPGYYLNHTFSGKENPCGSIFCGEGAENLIIYGHNMKNGSMFAQLLKYKDDSFYKEHPYFYIYTPDGKVRTYEIFSAGVVKDTSDGYIMDYADDAAFQTYIDYIKQQSAYPTSAEVTTASKIVSLSTCTNVRDDERFLVHGVMIKEEAVK